MHAVCMPDDDYVLMVEEENKLSRTVCANMIIGGQNVNFQIDSGATANVLPESEYVRVTDDSKLFHLQHTQTKLIMYNKTEVLPTHFGCEEPEEQRELQSEVHCREKRLQDNSWAESGTARAADNNQQCQHRCC